MKRYTFLLVPLFFGLLTACCTTPNAESFSIVIDAGSSGSRVYIYRITNGVYDDFPFVESVVDAKKVEPGISEMDVSPVAIMKGMRELIDFAKKNIKEDQWSSTPLYLMATAGMRLESEAEQEKTMAQLTDYFESTPFDFKEAMILSGQYEGLYAWIAINYLDDAFDTAKVRESMMEMGGASTQIAYVSDEADTQHVVARKFRGKDYDIYAKSYLLMGQDQAFQLTQSPDCFPVGLDLGDGQKGTGNFEACANHIETTYKESCKASGDPECLFDTGFKADVDDAYLAISAFYYTFDFFKPGDQITLTALKDTATKYCSAEWTAILAANEKKEPSKRAKEKYLKTYGFYAAYFSKLLEDGYQMDDELKIGFSNALQGEEPSWTWGAVIDLAHGNSPEAYVNPK